MSVYTALKNGRYNADFDFGDALADAIGVEAWHAAEAIISDGDRDALNESIDMDSLRYALADEFRTYDDALRDYFSEELGITIPEFMSDAERLDFCDIASRVFCKTASVAELVDFLGADAIKNLIADYLTSDKAFRYGVMYGD